MLYAAKNIVMAGDKDEQIVNLTVGQLKGLIRSVIIETPTEAVNSVVDVTGAAALLKCSERHVATLITRGLPVCDGGNNLFITEDIIKWLRTRQKNKSDNAGDSYAA